MVPLLSVLGYTSSYSESLKSDAEGLNGSGCLKFSYSSNFYLYISFFNSAALSASLTSF